MLEVVLDSGFELLAPKMRPRSPPLRVMGDLDGGARTTSASGLRWGLCLASWNSVPVGGEEVMSFPFSPISSNSGKPSGRRARRRCGSMGEDRRGVRGPRTVASRSSIVEMNRGCFLDFFMAVRSRGGRLAFLLGSWAYGHFLYVAWEAFGKRGLGSDAREQSVQKRGRNADAPRGHCIAKMINFHFLSPLNIEQAADARVVRPESDERRTTYGPI